MHYCIFSATDTGHSQTRKQMSGPNLHVFTLKFLALKNWFSPIKKYFPIFFYFCLHSMQLFSAHPKIFWNFLKIISLSIETLKNGPQKLLIIGTAPFISQSRPDHSPQSIIGFSNYESRDQTSVLLSVWTLQCNDRYVLRFMSNLLCRSWNWKIISLDTWVDYSAVSGKWTDWIPHFLLKSL